MTDRIARFFGLHEQPKRVRYLAKMAAIFMPLFGVTFTVSSTFTTVYIAEALVGPDHYLTLGMALVGNLAFLSSIIQLVLDYPTGGIGDWIGQRWILLTAFLCIAASTIYTAFAKTLFEFLLVYVIQAVGFAQLSGAFSAYFDTNYRAVADDPKRSAYSVAMGRQGMLYQVVAMLSLVPGAVLADLISRQGVFLLQGGLCVTIALTALALLRDFPEVAMNRPRRSMREYYGVLKDGVKFSFSSKFVCFYILGTVIAFSTFSVWGEMILFSIYYSFLYDQKAVALFRMLLFFVDFISLERAGVWTKTLRPSRWIAVFTFLMAGGAVFYFVFAVITASLPSLLVNSVPVPFPWMFFQLPAVIVCFAFVIPSIFSSGASVLRRRVELDLIPDRTRNAIYSLFPTLRLLIAAPQLFFFSGILPIFGPSPVLIGLGFISTSGCLLIALGMHFRPTTKKAEEPAKEEPPAVEADPTHTEQDPTVEGFIEPPQEELPGNPEEHSQE
ncbi:MAG: MFS transporter [Promethearchaeota archaeon]